MVEMSKDLENYFDLIQDKVNICYKLAEKAREQGLDPEIYVECPQAKDLAGRVEKLVGPVGVANIIRKLKTEGKNDDQIVFQVVSDILDKKIGNIDSLDERVERAIRVGLAIKTMGVVSAPLEGISKIKINEDQRGNKYLSLYFAGPIRAAGGTTAALCVLIADYVRRKSDIPKYIASEGEVGRYVEEVKLYDRRVHLQYPSSNEEIRFAVEHLPVEINGDATENEEVSAFRDLPRVETNSIRGGACLVLNDGIILKAPKLLKIAKAMNLKGWDWLADLKKLATKEEKQDKEEEKANKNHIPPNFKYIADIIAGRPVFSNPSEVGGHRIRYGRSRNTGLAAGGMHPATLVLLDRFVAIGTQLRIERPGKSTSICPVDFVEPPIALLQNGNVIKVDSMEKARNIFHDIDKILFIGDILFGFGEFAENNHFLIPSGYVEEWWAQELALAAKNKNALAKVKRFLDNPFEVIPVAEEAVLFSKEFNIPLHPKYLDFWGNITAKEFQILRSTFCKSFSKIEKSLVVNNEDNIKTILEKAFIPHRVKDGKIYFSKAMVFIYSVIFNLDEEVENKKEGTSLDDKDIFEYINQISPIEIRDKAPYYMGTRMGRPEKSERKSMKGIHALFPLSDKVGNSRSVEKAIELGKIKIDLCRKKCPNCGTITIFHKCPKCGEHTELKRMCNNCKKYFPKNEEQCPDCTSRLKSAKEAIFNVRNHVNSSLTKLKMYLPDKMKGIFGLTNEFKVPEPIEKGILRAKNDVMVYKTAEIRYDATDIPLTHFKPREIGTSIGELKRLGYEKDMFGKPLESEEQILKLKVQDILLSEDCAQYFIKVAKFLDDELEYFYKLRKFYDVNDIQDLIGHLVVGLAPHTSAGIIGRIIGVSPARSIYAHPFWHAAKRRNCDGDEDGLMLLLDPLLNFSRHYLPSKIGGRMDATLVISTLLDPNEIDVEAHNIDTLDAYPLDFYKSTLEFKAPSEIEKRMKLVKNSLGTANQYHLGFNIPTSDINQGPTMTAYKTYESMDEKIDAQLHLAKIIKSVNERYVAEKILSSHFNPDILGNLRKFSQQTFRCVKCNTKFRRPPLSNNGKCPACKKGNVILTVNRGGIEKYIPRAIKICNDYNLDSYTLQRMELIEEYVESLTNNPRIKQQKLSDFF
ncbi:MAG: DNA polymerase II large subunit [Candidatus Lokiarchaeota archaeon]|nr:DNA polymerase II large subunit [Candidatus Lokiarchaeota archaeon]MBD3342913.1 DNA polymerase II large subunit [Candidatus Lokiarchaeota archaeon]